MNWYSITTVTILFSSMLKAVLAKTIFNMYDLTQLLQVVILMGSPSDEEHCTKIAKFGAQLGLKCHLRCTSAHKGTEETLQILAEYEGISKYFNIKLIKKLYLMLFSTIML